ncbi:Uncharacterized protein QTN25_001898 [Entamoeba marina]
MSLITLPQHVLNLRISLFGSIGVGKTKILAKITYGSFDYSYDPTVEDSFSAQLQVDRRPVYVQLLDTYDSEEYPYQDYAIRL